MSRSVAGLLVSVFCSSGAAVAQVTVLGKLVYDLTNSKLDLGLLGLAAFAPAALLVLVTGTVADRWDRRRVVAVAALGEAAATAVLAWYVGTRPTSVVPMFLLLVAFGTFRAFEAPAARALPADMTADSADSADSATALPWLVARNSAAWQAGTIGGPVLGGFLLAADPRLPFVADALLLAAAAAAVGLVRVPSAPDARAHPVAPARAGLRDAREGLRFVRRRPILLGAISLDLFAVLFGGAVALLPAIARDRLGVGAVGLGWLRAAGGIGAAVMTLGLAVRPVTRGVGRKLFVAVGAFGVWTIVLGVTRNFALAFVAMAALSAADSISVFVRATLVPLVTPPDKRGRVLAVENVFIGASNELGAFESGVTAQLIGTSGSVVLGGAATLAVAVGWSALFPGLRRTDRFPKAAAAEP